MPVLIGTSDYSGRWEEQLIESFLERRPQGFILTGLQHRERAFFGLLPSTEPSAAMSLPLRGMLASLCIRGEFPRTLPAGSTIVSSSGSPNYLDVSPMPKRHQTPA